MADMQTANLGVSQRYFAHQPVPQTIVLRAPMLGTDTPGHRSVSERPYEMSGYLGQNIWRFAATQRRDSGSSL
jgi:hypothetical protein